MPYVLAVVAALLVLPAVGLGVLAVALALAAVAILFACALALGATGTVVDWILAATAAGLSWPAFQAWRRLVRRLKAVLATAGPGIGRLRRG